MQKKIIRVICQKITGIKVSKKNLSCIFLNLQTFAVVVYFRWDEFIGCNCKVGSKKCELGQGLEMYIQSNVWVLYVKAILLNGLESAKCGTYLV